MYQSESMEERGSGMEDAEEKEEGDFGSDEEEKDKEKDDSKSINSIKKT